MTKRCSKCYSEKQTTEFYRKSRSKDGLAAYCKACSNATANEWCKKHRDRRNAYVAKWRLVYAPRIRETTRTYVNQRNQSYKSKLTNSMHAGIVAALRMRKSGRRWESLVGYTAVELMAYLEQQFLPGMTWDNYGTWHIDHVLPRAFFEYDKPEDSEFQFCWQLKNLRPMWAKDNIRKGDSLDVELIKTVFPPNP